MSDQPTFPKAELMRRLRAGYGEWSALVERVSESRRTEPGAAGSWSVKDLIAHISSGHRWLAAQLDAARRGVPPTAEDCYGFPAPPRERFDMADNEQRNRWYFDQYRDWSLGDVTREARDSYERLLRVLDAYPAAELQEQYTIADYDNLGLLRRVAPEDDLIFPLSWLVYNYTFEHYPGHVADVRTWLDGTPDA